MRWWVAVAAWGAGLVGGLGCDDYEDVKIARDGPSKGRQDQPLSHTYTVSRTVDDAWFINCAHSQSEENDVEVDRAGKLTYTPKHVGELELCIEYRRASGELDRYEHTVTVRHRKGESPKELERRVEDFRPKLEAVHELTRAVERPSAGACKGAVTEAEWSERHEYGEAWLGSELAGGKLGADELVFKPPEAAVLSGEVEPNLKAVDDLVSVEHVLVIRTEKVEMPVLVSTGGGGPQKGGDAPGRFIGGSYTGVAFLVRVDKPKILCTQRFTAVSSEDVEWTETIQVEEGMEWMAELRGSGEGEANFQLRRDFYANVGQAKTEAMERALGLARPP